MRMKQLRVFVVVSLYLLHFVFAKQPNIVMILTDDQDITIGGMNEMPKTRQLLVDNGITFKNAFVSSPICCISRASILSGRYVHNHHTVNNSIAGNCSSKYWQTQIEPTCFAPYIEEEGYATFYAGKYLNTYGSKAAGGTQHIPIGWTDWKGLVGNSKYYNYNISDNGKNIHYGDNYTLDYYTNLIKNQSIQFLDTFGGNSSFLMVLATPASHAKFTPAPQYNYTNETAPRIPNFNYTETNGKYSKHSLLGMLIPMNDQAVYYTDYIYSQRHGTLRSVDDMVQNVYNKIDALGQIDNTYFIYTSDHGYHSGQFGMGWDKRQLYENDIRIPFVIMGPGIMSKSITNKIALNIDIAPTIIELVTGDNSKIPEVMDGQSLVPWLFNKTNDDEIKQQFLIEYYGSSGDYKKSSICADVYPSNIDGWSNYCDSWNNTYDCIRMIDSTKDIGQINGTIYCQFKCYGPGKIQIKCDDDGSAQTYGEYYELDNDYYQLNNIMLQLNETSKQMYEDTMKQFLSCKGQTQCNQLRQW